MDRLNRPRYGTARGPMVNVRRWWSAVAGGLLVWAAARRMDVAGAFVVVAVPMTLLELWRPLHRRRPALSRSGAGTGLVNFVVSEVLGLTAAVGVLTAVAPPLAGVIPVMVREHLAGQAVGVRWLEAVVVAELGGYWGHRLCHELPALWRFHRVHHSSTELDWIAAGRRHPVDAAIARLSTALPMLLLGFAVPTVATVFVLKRIRGLIVHANVNVRWPRLERLYVTPFFHHWHHSDESATWNTNYAVAFPVLDWLFGTLHLPDHWPSDYGCDGQVPNRGYIAQLLSPWRSCAWKRRSDASTVVALSPSTSTTT